MKDVLLLFAHEDTEPATRLEGALRARGHSVIACDGRAPEGGALRELRGALRVVVLISRHTQWTALGEVVLWGRHEKPESVCVVWLEPAEVCAEQFRSWDYGIFWQMKAHGKPDAEIVAGLRRWQAEVGLERLGAHGVAVCQWGWLWAQQWADFVSGSWVCRRAISLAALAGFLAAALLMLCALVNYVFDAVISPLLSREPARVPWPLLLLVGVGLMMGLTGYILWRVFFPPRNRLIRRNPRSIRDEKRESFRLNLDLDMDMDTERKRRFFDRRTDETKKKRQVDYLKVESHRHRLTPSRSKVPEAPPPKREPQRDLVHFSVTTAKVLQPGQAEEVRVWAHMAGQRSLVLKQAHDEHGRKDLSLKSRGPLPTQRGTVFDVQLHVPGAAVQPQEEQLVWEGEIAHTGFTVVLPAGHPVGSVAGVVVISVHGLTVARLAFAIQVSGGPQENTEPQVVTAPPYQSAFASYAEKDRDEVLGRIQGMQKALPGLDVFMDVARMRSGQDWQAQLGKEIKERDVLFLFWSRAASKSKWVDWEWRHALEHKGKRGIDPVPIEPPHLVAPPHELSGMHFNDWVLGYMRWGKRKS